MISKIECYIDEQTGMKLTFKGCFASRTPDSRLVDIAKKDFRQLSMQAIELSRRSSKEHNLRMEKLATEANELQNLLLRQYGPLGVHQLMSSLGILSECTRIPNLKEYAEAFPQTK